MTKDNISSVKGKEKNSSKRWGRNGDGTYRYRGRCPFNLAVCRVANVFVSKTVGPRQV